MANKGRSGGPKTQSGKARSAQNAKKHGLTTMSPSSADENAQIESFAQELIAYYQPQSPLEFLQIQRIATCQAKLKHLYELEQIKLTMARKELEAQPEKIFEKIPKASGLTKRMALDWIQSGQFYLPCRLNESLLDGICTEIGATDRTIVDPDAFARHFPQLVGYLKSYPVVGMKRSTHVLELLADVAKEIEAILTEEEGPYLGRWEEFGRYYSLGKKYEILLKEEASREEQEKLQRYQEEVVRPRHNLKPRPEEPRPSKDEGPVWDFRTAVKHLQKFLILRKAVKSATKIATQYQEMFPLMMRAVSLPTAESDVLMRYQTTLERRLSQAIGELLELQKRRRLYDQSLAGPNSQELS